MNRWFGSAGVLLAIGTAALLAAGSGTGSSSITITTCGQTATASAVLGQDLSCASSDGVDVGAPGITVNLNGHTITGGGGNFGVDDSGGYDGVRIENGVLRGFEYGLRAINGVDKLSVTNVVASGNTLSGIVVVGDFAFVKSTTASGNSELGTYVDGSSAKVQSAVAAGNGLGGIEIIGGSAQVQSSSASGNGNDGIFVTGTSAKIRSSSASGNENDGIHVVGNAGRITGNRTDANGFPGGASDNAGLGIEVGGYTTFPVGTNAARGNDDPVDCFPASIC